MIQLIEELSINAWPALNTKIYDGWVLRFANGYTKRSNSVNPLYHSNLPLFEKIRYCEQVYCDLNLPVVFKLTVESYPYGIDDELASGGYSKMDETAVRILPLNHYKYQKSDSINIEISQNHVPTDWLKGFFTCAEIMDPTKQLKVKQLLGNISGEVIWVSKIVSGNRVGCGFGAIERGYVGIFDVVVKQDFRGSGYGQEMVEGILNAATGKGIKTAYLSVVVGNRPAEKLYDKLGFQELYRYWYRIKD